LFAPFAFREAATFKLLSMSEALTNIQQQQNKMEQTTARLRKTFQYPTDNDSEDSLPEVLDEEGVFPSYSFLDLSIQPLAATDLPLSKGT
jgi:hypothetical protein